MTGRPIIAWYNASDWADLKTLCPDLHDTYAEWLNNAKSGVAALGLGPHDYEKVILTPDEIRNWQASNSGEINSEVRAKLAMNLATAKRRTTH